MSRYKAAAIHLLFSCLVLATIFLLIAYVWYPHKMFELAAGFELLRLIVAVDLIIGPLVMLIIFDARKKLIKLDVAIILICQIGFMSYGIWSMFSARPVFLVFSEEHFYLVRANEIESKDLLAAKNEEFHHLPLSGPINVGAKISGSSSMQQDLMFAGLGGMGIQNLPQYFVPYEQVASDVLKSGKTLQQMGVDVATKKRISDFEKKFSGRGLYLPMVNKSTPLIVVIDPKTAQIIDVI